MLVKNRQELLVTNRVYDVKKKVLKGSNKELKSLFQSISFLIKKELKKHNEENFNKNDLMKLRKKIKKELKNKNGEAKKIIEKCITEIIDESIKNNLNFYKEIDKIYSLDIYPFLKAKYTLIKNDVSDKIIKGHLYNDNKTLEARMIRDVKRTISTVDVIIKENLKEDKNYFNTAKQLEKYFNPNTNKRDYSDYKGIKTRVESNYERLLKTSINHAHHQTVISMAKENPFIKEIEWLSSRNHGRTCPLCASRDGKRYLINDVPIDHPNGMCMLIEVYPSDTFFEELSKAFMESDYDSFEDFILDNR